ncbi:MAG: hypothetical protein AAF841_14600, partial [Pseudomonadota bacterium]
MSRRKYPQNNWRAGMQFGVQYTLLLLSFVVIASGFESAGIWLALALVTGSATVAAMYAAAHETLHRTAFRSQRLNRVVYFLA